MKSQLAESYEPGTQATAPEPQTTELHGWGRYPSVSAKEVLSENLEMITEHSVLSRGLGRSYGDTALPPPGDHVVSTSVLADRLLAFDADSGLLRAEAGLSLARMNRIFLPRGWFTPVTPGTQQVTLGGMVAADVHGKNHHVEGCFGEHVRALRMRTASGRLLECSEQKESELFRATLGGLGLTGHILEVEFQMKPIPSPWIWAESERVPDLDSLLDALKRSSAEWPYTVCWADCLRRGAGMGRGVVTRGRWAEPKEARSEIPKPRPAVSVPLVCPNWLLNRWSMGAFNAFYYALHGEKIHRGIVHPEAFFYPLDTLHNWNRIYGSRGFTQYQCVLPPTASRATHRRLLELIIERNGGAFLCVVKDCGKEGRGMLSFPRLGISYALDFPVGPETQSLVDAMNELVIREGGRVYLIKDAFTRAGHYRAMDARVDSFNAVRRKWDTLGKLRSAQSVRVLGDAL